MFQTSLFMHIALTVMSTECARMIDKGKQLVQHKGAVDNLVKSGVAFCVRMLKSAALSPLKTQKWSLGLHVFSAKPSAVSCCTEVWWLFWIASRGVGWHYCVRACLSCLKPGQRRDISSQCQAAAAAGERLLHVCVCVCVCVKWAAINWIWNCILSSCITSDKTTRVKKSRFG